LLSLKLSRIRDNAMCSESYIFYLKLV